MPSLDLVLAMYASARTELIERIRLRDQVLLAYLAAVGAIFAVAFGDKGNAQVLLALPFLAVGAGVLVSQHNDAIGSLSAYCARELQDYIRATGPEVPQWDASREFARFSGQAFSLRHKGATLILVVPSMSAIAIAFWDLIQQPQLCFKPECGSLVPTAAALIVMTLLGLVATAWCGYLLWRSHRWRQVLAASSGPSDSSDPATPKEAVIPGVSIAIPTHSPPSMCGSEKTELEQKAGSLPAP